MIDNSIVGVCILLAIFIFSILINRRNKEEVIQSGGNIENNVMSVDLLAHNRNTSLIRETAVGTPTQKAVDPAQEIEDPLESLDDFEPMPELSSLKGVGPKYRELLEAAGLGNLDALAAIDPEDLVRRVEATNEEMRIVRQRPPRTKIIGWHENAKSLLLEASIPNPS